MPAARSGWVAIVASGSRDSRTVMYDQIAQLHSQRSSRICAIGQATNTYHRLDSDSSPRSAIPANGPVRLLNPHSSAWPPSTASAASASRIRRDSRRSPARPRMRSTTARSANRPARSWATALRQRCSRIRSAWISSGIPTSSRVWTERSCNSGAVGIPLAAHTRPPSMSGPHAIATSGHARALPSARVRCSWRKTRRNGPCVIENGSDASPRRSGSELTGALRVSCWVMVVPRGQLGLARPRHHRRSRRYHRAARARAERHRADRSARPRHAITPGPAMPRSAA
jgi:hypothetical protein